MEATFFHGSPLMVDYTPTADVAAGQVVVIGAKMYIAHNAIAANTLGAVAAFGGVYKSLASGDYGPGQAVYWNDTTNKLTQAVGSHKHIGYIVPNSDPAADGDVTIYEHNPNGGATAAS